jgi:hypothetical protein
MNLEDDDILEAARTIRPHLSNLIPDDAITVDEELALHLNDTQTGKPSGNVLLGILRRREPTRRWLSVFLNQRFLIESTRGFQPPPGNPVPVSAQKYVCPQGDYAWYRASAGSLIPRCPTHGVTLVAAP